MPNDGQLRSMWVENDRDLFQTDFHLFLATHLPFIGHLKKVLITTIHAFLKKKKQNMRTKPSKTVLHIRRCVIILNTRTHQFFIKYIKKIKRQYPIPEVTLKAWDLLWYELLLLPESLIERGGFLLVYIPSRQMLLSNTGTYSNKQMTKEEALCWPWTNIWTKA